MGRIAPIEATVDSDQAYSVGFLAFSCVKQSYYRGSMITEAPLRALHTGSKRTQDTFVFVVFVFLFIFAGRLTGLTRSDTVSQQLYSRNLCSCCAGNQLCGVEA